MRLNRTIALIAAVSVLLTGCTSNQASTDLSEGSTAEPTIEEGQASSEETQYVQVTSIDGGVVTGVLGTLSQQKTANDSGEGGVPGAAPEGGAPGSAPADGATPPEKPSGSGQGGETPPDQPSNSNGNAPEGNGGTPPETPSNNGGTPPADGENPQGTPPDGQRPGMSNFEAGTETITFSITDETQITMEFFEGSQEGSIADIAAGSILEITLQEDQSAASVLIKNMNAGGGFGGSDALVSGKAVTTISEDQEITGEAYGSQGDDENALKIAGAKVTLTDITLNKSAGASSNTENGDFYGMNAGLLATGGAEVTITGATLNTAAVNGNAVFSYGEGTSVTISKSTIRTTERNSGGLQTTGGAAMNAYNLDVETLGDSSAAIRSDRGGGTVSVDGGSYVTYGVGSPSVYSTADITVKNASLSANNAEAVVVEGKNSVRFQNCDLTGNMTESAGGEDENIHNIMLYQSMSGDAEVGHSTFEATGGSITSKCGDLFYVTNTTSTITLEQVSLTLANDNLLTVAGNSSSRGWGTAGSNGGICTFEAKDQRLMGAITVDEISSLDISLANGSAFEGSMNAKGQAGTINVILDEASTWTLTADSYISSFTGNAANIVLNGHTVYVNGAALTA